jgi:hypothetical protein
MDVNSQVHTLVALLLGKEYSHLLNKVVPGPQNPSELCGEEGNILPLPRNSTLLPQLFSLEPRPYLPVLLNVQ